MADTQGIKDRIDIAQLIGEYVQVKKAGANWKANCPFHHEKSPSFMIHPEKQIWHCFGCGKGGDIFTFIQEIEGVDFIEALKLLARRAGVEIDTFKNELQSSERNRLQEINKEAAYFFHRFLLDVPQAKTARDYLEGRGLKKQTILDWQVGFAPDQWDLLTKYLVKKGFGINDIINSGLTIKRDQADEKTGQGFYDRFRGRIMFPIGDVHGNIVGFTGRVLVENERSGGKYVNTPQTMLYDKSRVLYGLHKAKTAIKNQDLAILVEGQMDVIANHQAGFTNVVAASGTALTQEQIRLLKRYSNNIAMAFDADQAGQNAGKRGIEVAIEEGMNIRVIQIPDDFAKDADECIKKDPTIWQKAVKDAKGVIDWYFSLVLKGLDKNDPKKKQQAADVLLKEIARIPFSVERDDWLRRLAVELDIEITILRDEVKNIKTPAVKSFTPVKKEEKPVKISTPLTGVDEFGQEFWSLLLKFPVHYPEIRQNLRKEYFVDSILQNLYEKAENLYNKVAVLKTDDLRAEIADKQTENIVDILILKPFRNSVEISAADAKNDLLTFAVRLKEAWRKRRGKEIQFELAQAEKNKDRAKIEVLMIELQKL